LRAQSAICTAVTTITRTVTVAAGVFAAGHLGELTGIVAFDLVDVVLAETRSVERRLRLLPSRVGVHFVLALALFRLGYSGLWAKLTATFDEQAPCPSGKALRDLRRRLGPAPLRQLFELLSGPMGRLRTPGVYFGPYRTVAFDGCRSVNATDTERNRGWPGKLNAAAGVSGYSAIQLMTLVETCRRVPVIARLPGGSVVSLIGTVTARIITANVTVTYHDGTVYGDTYRLATTLTDHRAWPAADFDQGVLRTVGTRDHLPPATPHPAHRAGAALGRPCRPGTGDVGAASALPGAANRRHAAHPPRLSRLRNLGAARRASASRPDRSRPVSMPSWAIVCLLAAATAHASGETRADDVGR